MICGAEQRWVAGLCLALAAGCAASHDRSAPDATAAPDAATPQCEGDGYDPFWVRFVVVDAHTDEPITNFSVNGLVVEVGQGSIPEEAAQTAALHGLRAEHVHYVRVEDRSIDRDVIALTNALPFGFPVTPRTQAGLRTRSSGGGFEPEVKSLHMFVDGKLAFSLGRDVMPERLQLPTDIRVSMSAPTCTVVDTCGRYTLHPLELRVDGEQRTLDALEEAVLGDYRFLHLRTAQQAEGSVRCADWFVADSTLAIARREIFDEPVPLGPDASAAR